MTRSVIGNVLNVRFRPVCVCVCTSCLERLLTRGLCKYPWNEGDEKKEHARLLSLFYCEQVKSPSHPT